MTVRQLLLTLLVTLVVPMLPQELYAWCPTVAGWLLRLAARLVPAPHRARYKQEWLAQLDAWEGRNLAALLYALSILVQTPRMRLALRSPALAPPQRRRIRVNPHLAYRLSMLFAALTAAALTAWLSLEVGGPALTGMVDHSTQAAAALCAGAACFYASRRVPFVGRTRRTLTRALRLAWRLLGAAAVSSGLATLLWAYHDRVPLRETPLPLVDAWYLAAIPLLVTGMLAFPIAVGHPAARIRTLLDALIIAASLLAVSWVTTIAPLLDPNRPGPRPASLPQQVVELARPTFDILLATIALSLLARTRRRDPAPTTVLCLALLALAVASSGYVHLVATDRYGTYSLIDLGAVAGWLLVLVAALRPTAAHIDQREERDQRQPLAPTTLPYALLALAILTVITVRIATDGLDRFLFLDLVALAALVVARQLVTMIENRQLNRRLERKVEELSEREAQLARALAREHQAAERLRLRVRELEDRMGPGWLFTDPELSHPEPPQPAQPHGTNRRQ
jgi:hypothetical protein